MSRLKLVITDRAVRDLVERWDYVADHSVRSADRQVGRIPQTCQILADTPDIGKKRDGLRPGLRSFPSNNYLIFYTISDNAELQVVRILSGYRDLDALF